MKEVPVKLTADAASKIKQMLQETDVRHKKIRLKAHPNGGC